MAKRFKEARLHKGIKLTDAAKHLDVTQPTLSSWESERKTPSIEALERMADLYGVTTDYLLGRDIPCTLNDTIRIPKELLPIMHGKPVWIKNQGWALVNAAHDYLIKTDGEHLHFAEVLAPVTVAPDRFENTPMPYQKPLTQDEVLQAQSFWVEPISPDSELRQALRGRYLLKNGFAENEFGQRFSLNSYGATWLAFKL